VDRSGDAGELGDAGVDSGKSFLFFLTGGGAWKRLGRSGGSPLGRAALVVWSGAFATALENPREETVSRPAVLTTAAGLQGEEPLVDGAK
jgi:hypothetical protein